MDQIVFGFAAAVAVASALVVILQRNPTYAAFSLILTLCSMSVIYALLGSPFIAVLQIVVYAGAIMVLFLFVIMLLNLKSDAPFGLRFTAPKVLGVAIALGIAAQLIGAFNSPAAKLGPSGPYPIERVTEEGSTEIIGELLFTDYVLPFEMISILLLVAVIGAVVLAKRRPPAESGGDRA